MRQLGNLTQQPIPSPQGRSLGNINPTQPKSSFSDNLERSAIENVKAIGSAVAHPVQTAKSMWGLGSGLVSKFLPGRQKSEQNVDNLVSYYKDKYRGGVGKAFYEDPFGVALDASAVLGGTGAIVKGVGTAGRMANMAKVGSTIGKVGSAIDPISGSVRAVRGINKAISGSAKPAMAAKADQLLTSGLGNPAKQVDLKIKYGQSVPDFMRKYEKQYPGLMTRDPEAAKAAVSGIGQKFDQGAIHSGQSVPTREVIKAFDDKINELSQGFGDVNPQLAPETIEKINKIKELKKQFLDGIVKQGNVEVVGSGEVIKPGKHAINSGIAKPEATIPVMDAPLFSPLDTGVSDLTAFRKRVVEPATKSSDYALNANKVSGAKEVRNLIRKQTIKAVPELEQLGLDYGMALNVEDIISKAASRASNRQLFNFTKLGTAGAGAFLNGIPGLVGGFLTEQIVNHPLFLSYVSNMLNSAAKTRGAAVNPVFSKVGSGTYLFGKTGRATNASQKEPR